MRPAGGLPYNQSDLRLTHNLRKLLDAATQFHSTASSTASTIRDGTNGHWMAHGDQAVSLMGDFPATRRQWVEEYVRTGRHQRYQSPDSSGQQSPRRTLSPRRPRSPPTSPRVTSFVAIDGITARPPAEVVSDEETEQVEKQDDDNDDDDDDDNAEAEADAERAFQDRLHELALDRFKTRDYSNAIDFLQRILKPEPPANSAKVEHRQLQIQLVVCHFLQGDWKLAEAILTGLSKKKIDRDSVICTLLHALSLAYLFHYSFDLALSIGQQALQGRRRLFKLGKICCSEVDETRALLATIYDVRGGNDDYIRADVLNGQLAEHFEYKHPKSEITFITDHPNLLSTVFGDDIPENGPATHAELPGEACNLEMRTASPVDAAPSDNMNITRQPTSALRRRQSVTGGVSPLRSKLTDHWRYEQDTNKCAISSPVPAPMPLSPDTMDADDEASTHVETPTPVTIKHRLTRLLTYRRSRPIKPEDVPDVAVSPTANVPPTSRWLRGSSIAGRTQSNKLVRKRSEATVPKRQKLSMSCRLRGKRSTDQTEVSDSDESGARIMQWLRSQSPDRDNEDCASVVARAGSSNGSLCGLPKDYFGTNALPVRSASTITSNDKARAFDNYMDRGLPSDPYKSNDNVLAMETDRNACQARIGVGMYHELPNTSICPELMDTGPLAELSGPSLITANIMDTNKHLGHSAREITRYPSLKVDTAVQEKSRETEIAITSSTSFRLRRCLPSLQTGGLAETSALRSVSEQLAELFAAIPNMTDGKERHATMLSLDRLLPLVTSVFHDPVLGHDIRRTIKMLASKSSFGADDASDSGYETMSTDRTEPTKSVSQFKVEAESESEHNDDTMPESPTSKPSCLRDRCRKVTVMPTSPNLKYSLSSQRQTYPGLKRAFSFVVGVEDDFSWHRPGDVQANDKEEPFQSSKKMVSFALEPDPKDEFKTCDTAQTDGDVTVGEENDRTGPGGSIEVCDMETESCRTYGDQRQRTTIRTRNVWRKFSLGRKAFWRTGFDIE